MIPDAKRMRNRRVEIHILNQTDPQIAELGPFDIVIDDGSHVISDQEASFRNLWPVTTGIYLIEDCHNGYPQIDSAVAVVYPWVLVCERPKRMIRGKPSRELRQDEIDAINLYSDLSAS